MKTKTIGIIITLALLMGGLGLFLNATSRTIYSGPCHGYQEVGEFAQKIRTADDAKQIALDYYSSIGYQFASEDLFASKTDNGWSIGVDYTKLETVKLCIGTANPPECIGQKLRLKENFFGKNKILMEYQIPC